MTHRENLFVYGTLRNPEVQKKVFGRSMCGVPDVLMGYARSSVVIEGRSYCAIRRATGGVIRGMVLVVTKKELGRVDAHETNAYIRIRIRLQSGRMAWVYVKHAL